MSIFTPVNQVRLTNVAVVRLRRKGKRFELACYKNKVSSWRDKTESDLDEVLQTRSIFASVSKGILAKRADLVDTFRTDDENVIIEKILRDGELQVAERERHAVLESTFRDIATLVSEQCIDLNTNRPPTVASIEKAMKEQIHYSINQSRNAKQQSLDVIRLLKEVLPIERSRMRLRLSGRTTKDAKSLLRFLEKIDSAVIETSDWGAEFSVVVVVDPGTYRSIESEVLRITRGSGKVDILDLRLMSMSTSSAMKTTTTT